MSAVLILAWSLLMAAPPLAAGEKQREYDLVKVAEVLTTEQTQLRDVLEGWRPRPPLSDIERSVDEIVPGEPNPYLVLGTWKLAGKGLTPQELDRLGKPSPSPRGFRSRTNAREAWWYEQIDDKGQMTGIWLALYKAGSTVEGYVMVGRLAMPPGVFSQVGPGIDAGTAAMRALKAHLAAMAGQLPGE